MLTNSSAEVIESYKQLLDLTAQDSTESYFLVQQQASKILSMQSNHLPTRLLLCLAYREVWPFVVQDGYDIETFALITQTTKALNPTDEAGILCEVSKMLALGRVHEARGVVDYHLSESQASSLGLLVYFKGEILGKLQQLEQAHAFLLEAHRLWPRWAKPLYMAGHYAMLNGDIKSAYAHFNQVKQAHPKHKATLLQLGILEAEFNRAFELATGYFDQAFALTQAVNRQLEVRGYFVGATTALKAGQEVKAKKWIETAYALSPNDHEIKKLFTKLGGELKRDQKDLRHQELVYLGDQYAAMGDCLAAQAEYKAAFELDSRNATAAFKAGRCLWRLRQYPDAIDWLKKSLKADPKYFEAAALLADFYSARFDFNQAIEVLLQATRYKKNSAEVLRSFGLVELRRNNLKPALDYFKRALKLMDYDVETLVALTQTHLANRDLEQAQNTIIRALEVDPSSIAAISEYAKILAYIKGVDAGLHYLQGQIKRFSFTLDLKMATASLLLQAERLNEAETLFLQLVEYDPQYKEAWLGLAKTQHILAKLDLAQKSYIEASILDALDPEPIYRLGLLTFELGQNDRALRFFQESIKLNPNYPGLYYYAGRAAFAKKDYDLALGFAKKEKQKNPNLADGYLLAGEVFDQKQEYQQCAKEYQSVIKLRPQSADLYVKMSRCYRLSGSLDIAENMLNVAASFESGLPEIYRELALIFESKSDRKAAIGAYEKYLDLSPNAKDRKQVAERLSNLQQEL